MTGGLTRAMLREHRWSYVGLAVVLIAASTVVGSSFILFEGARTADIDVSGLGGNEAAKLFGLAFSGRFISSFMAVLGAFVAVMLVSQTMSFVVDGRRRELALLRLAGASPSQTTGMVLKESVILGLACSVVGAVLALPLAAPYAEILSWQNNWPPDFPVTVHASALIWCVVVMTLVAVFGAFTAARRIGRTAPIDAVRAVATVRKNMPLMRWILAGVGLVAVFVFLLLPPQSLNHQITTAGVGAGAVLLVSALAPVVVPSIARVFGGAVTLIAPGAGLVAREHTTHDARRTAALATPIIILLGLGSVFGIMAQTGRSEMALGLDALTHTDVVVEFDSYQSDPDALQAAAALPESGSITQVQHADDWAWNEPDMPIDDFPQLMGIDPDTFTHFVPAVFESGSIDDISGTDVAVLTGVGDVGDTFNLEAPDGTSLTVHVVAVVESTSFVYGTFLVDLNGVPLDTGITADTWLVESASGTSAPQLITALEHVDLPGQTFTHNAWVEESVAHSVASQQAAILTIVGGAAILALFSLGQSTLASVRERRDELELLTKLGARRRSVIGSIVVESGITAVTASILAVAVTGLVYARMATALHALNPALSPIIPSSILMLILAACVLVSITSATVGATLSLSRIRRRQ
ncbi:MAG: FtsX-like permease family protein [Brevibacterium yomogidense]